MEFNILLIEDSLTDAAIMVTAFERVGCSGRIQVAQDGIEAIDFLGQMALNDEVGLPQLILLDLNLPCKSGYEVLDEIKKNPRWQCIPAIVLSSSSTSLDITKSYQLRANAYIAKPITLEGYELVARRIHDFWLQTAKLPMY
ncbi:MAG: response regulator [Leptolyngbyaceae cyanobacterium MO_188.B28]|nr:response regulator [Leptolyngbyaceae cyanobacterium MO_188.B28]